MSFRSLLRHRCAILRNVTQNVDGVFRPHLATLASGVPCLIQEQLGQVSTGDAGLHLQYDAIAFFLPVQDIRPRGKTGDTPDVIEHCGVKYTVLHVGDESGMGHHLVAKLRRESR